MRLTKNGFIKEQDIQSPQLTYEQRIVNRIREKYSVDDELAILRQRNTKPDEFSEYNAFVERIKAEEQAAVQNWL